MAGEKINFKYQIQGFAEIGGQGILFLPHEADAPHPPASAPFKALAY